MKYAKAMLLVTTALVLSACALRQSGSQGNVASRERARERRQMLFGWWIQSAPENRARRRMEVTLRCPDGIYFSDLRVLGARGDIIEEQQEVGDWGISGPVYFSIVRGGYRDGKRFTANTTQRRYYHAYQIRKLSYTSLQTRNYETGQTVSSQRATPAQLSELRAEKRGLPLPSSCKSDDSGG